MNVSSVLRRIVTLTTYDSIRFRLLHWGLLHFHSRNLQMQSVYLRDLNAITRHCVLRADSIPCLTMHEDLAFRRECGLRSSNLADHAFLSGDHFVHPGFVGDAHQENCDQRDRDAHGQSRK
jgi:hypothetical protein